LDGGDEEEIGGCGRVCQVEKEVGWAWNGCIIPGVGMAWCLEMDDEWHTGQEFSQLRLQLVILWLGENDRSATLSLILTWRVRRYAKISLDAANDGELSCSPRSFVLLMLSNSPEI
jgi:hypothetical protein